LRSSNGRGALIQTEADIQEERRLIAAAQAGDERAFQALIEPQRRALEVHCYRMLGSIHDAEEIVQETLLRAWRKLESFERRASVETWLYRIATNACLDELERRPRRAKPVDPYPDELLASTSPIVDPIARYAMHEGVELAFLTAIQRLPGRQRAVLILRDVLGWSASEAADLLETTVAGVNSALQRARATIDAEMPASSRTAASKGDRELLAEYVAAWESVDMDGLVGLLREDAALRMPPRAAIVGARAIAEFFRTGPCSNEWGPPELTVTRANGRPAVTMQRRLAGDELEPHGVMVFEVAGGVIVGLDAYIEPDLVAYFTEVP
jgi:RNA polymerase sigma-70 factor (ECF subfamily)